MTTQVGTWFQYHTTTWWRSLTRQTTLLRPDSFPECVQVALVYHFPHGDGWHLPLTQAISLLTSRTRIQPRLLCAPSASVRAPQINSFYRKTFSVPAAWAAADGSVIKRGDTLRLVFEGVYKVATVYLNGVYLGQHGDSSAAYTSFTVPLDPANGLKLTGSNVVAISVDASYGTEHWYAGAGIYRHVWFERAPAVSVVPNGLFAPTTLASDYSTGTVSPSIELANAAAAASGTLTVSATLYAIPSGANSGTSTATVESIPANGTITALLAPIKVVQPALWTIRSPSLYTLVTTVTTEDMATETVNVTVGFRLLKWDYTRGLSLNGVHTKIRGFCTSTLF